MNRLDEPKEGTFNQKQVNKAVSSSSFYELTFVRVKANNNSPL